MFGNNPTLRFPGNLAQVSNITELRGVSPYEMNDESAILVTAAGLFTFDASSTENDDGVSVIRPNGFTPLQAGRWVQPGPRTPDLPTTSNTFATLAALQASGLDVAYLVGDPANPNGTFFKVGSTLEREKSSSLTFGAKSYGARGDGTGDDRPAIQAQFDDQGGMLRQRGGIGYLPMGLHPMGAPIDLKSFTDWHGDGPRATILDQESNPVNYPAFKWDYAGVLYGFASVSDVGARGFSHGVLITQDTDEVNLRRMHLANMSSAGVQVTGMLQTGIFDEVKIENSNNGIISSSAVCNAMRFMKCDTRNISGEHIKLNGSEGCLIGGHRAEGGGLGTGITFNLSNTRNLVFEDLYAESTHRKIARIVGSTGVVDFSHCHFTGTGAGGAVGPYIWETDGTGGLNFHCTDSIYYPMRVPAHAKLEGTNPGLIPCVFAGKDSNFQNTMSSNDFALLRITRLNTAADAANVTQLRATLTLQITYLSAGASTLATVDREIEVIARAQGSSLSIDAVTRHASDFGIGANATLTGTSTTAGTASAASGLLTMQMPGVVPDGAIVYKRSASIIWNQISSLDGNTFAVELQ